jgi:conserved repeat domain
MNLNTNKKQANIKKDNMKTISKKIINIAISVILFAVLISAFAIHSVSAWGPTDRQTFTVESPAPFRTFNSITDHPTLGNEQNFVRIREAGVGAYKDEVELVPGKEYEVYTYFHNNAASNLNSTGVGIAQNVRMRAQYPSVVKPGQRGMVSSEITSTNTTPASVWDEAYMTSTSIVALRYVASSAVIYNSGAANGRVLSTNLFGEIGTYLGYNELNGLVPGCAEYSGFVVYRLIVDQPNFEIKKTVSRLGENNWQNSVNIKLGEEVEYKITYRNTGTIDQADVTIKDQLPAGMEYIKGSTKLTNNADPNGSIIRDGITSEGVNIGLYGSDTEATVVFRAKAVREGDSVTCTKNSLRNTATALTGNGSKSDSADVIVDDSDDSCTAIITTTATTEPETPTELPVTGPIEAILAVIAVLAITVGLTYWYKSHEAVKRAIEVGSQTTDSTDSVAKANEFEEDIHPRHDELKGKHRKEHKHSKKQ